nr:F-box domain, leucine-rich repeat domain, L domain-like protein [Tanacetum cinerariifolium]
MSADVARSHGGDGGGPVDLRPHMKSPDWTEINADIQQHLQRARARPENIAASEWNDPRNIARAAQNRQNRAKSTRQTSTTQEYPSLIDTFFVAHTVNEEFLRDEDRSIYEKMRRLEATGTYTDDEINRLARGCKQRGHIPGVGMVYGSQPAQFESGGASGSGGCGDEEEGADHQDDEDEDEDGDGNT